MANLNKVMLIGRLTADPELRHTSNNTAVTSFTLAINRRFQKAGEPQVADFIDIVCWRNNAEFASKYFKKGQSVFVSGSLQVRTWKDKEEKNRKSVEVIADEVQFAEPKRDGSKTESDVSFSNNPSNEDFQEVSSDDELPF